MSEIEKLTEQVRKLTEIVADLAVKVANPMVVTHYHHSVPQVGSIGYPQFVYGLPSYPTTGGNGGTGIS